MTEVEDQAPPKGCIWRKASDLTSGDRVMTDNGTFRQVHHTERANAEGPCVWIFWKGGGDEVAGKSDEFAVEA